MRILHAPSNIANQASALAHGLGALGHEAEVWHYGPNPFSFPADRSIDFPPRDTADLWRLVHEAVERFDVFHFHYARSLVPRQMDWLPGLWDLPLYQAAGKRVFFTFHGSDVRVKSKHLELDEWSYFRFADVECDEDDIAKRLEVIRTYANGLWICSPVNRPFVPDARFHPRALVLEDWPHVGPASNDVPVVVHVPSRRATKGTNAVLAAVERAKERGLRFEFRLIEGVPNAEVRAILEGADVLVDNLLLGDYEVTGLEAMALGKTVIARVVPAVEERMGPVPVLSADPATIDDVLTRAVEDAALRERVGKEARAFVEEHHDSVAVARTLVERYEDPERTLPVGFPGWASVGETRRVERLEEEVVRLTAGLRQRGKEVVLAGTRRGPFALAGSRIDRWLRELADMKRARGRGRRR